MMRGSSGNLAADRADVSAYLSRVGREDLRNEMFKKVDTLSGRQAVKRIISSSTGEADQNIRNYYKNDDNVAKLAAAYRKTYNIGNGSMGNAPAKFKEVLKAIGREDWLYKK